MNPTPRSSSDEPLGRGLYLVATPIGNLDDITLRALSVLTKADLILAEDTRRTRKLLTHYEIGTQLKPLHEHNEDAQARRLAERLAEGESMAVVSDAGTPLISDPGFPLVREALARGIPVVPVPGASSVLAALTASGLPTDRFTFVGYLPRKHLGRRRFLEALAAEPGTLLFLESPRRLAAAIADAADILGPRRAVVAREMTKVHEEFIRGTLPDIAAQLAGAEVRGEVTVCVAGHGEESVADREVDAEKLQEIREAFEELTAGGMARNESVKQLARQRGLPRRAVYRAVLSDAEEADASQTTDDETVPQHPTEES